MPKSKLKFAETEVIEKENDKTRRYPNLSTVMMVEDFLKMHRDKPMKISDMKKNLPKQIMHQTLNLILEYLENSGKIYIGPKGITWIYNDNPKFKKLLEKAVRID